MRFSTTIRCAAAGAGLLLVLSACDRPVEMEPVDAGLSADSSSWRPLFNGTDLTDWRGYAADETPARWEVLDSTLHLATVDSQGGDLMTRETFERFELSFEFRLSECANSGVIYGVDPSGQQSWHSGVEYQILDGDCARWQSIRDDQKMASAYELFPADSTVKRPVGEWNEGRIVMDGARVEHWLNGRKVVEYERGSEAWSTELADSKFTEWSAFGTVTNGHIALQDHGDEVWFRNVRIRTLSE